MRDPRISLFKPIGWHRMDGLDARIYRMGASIDGVADILQSYLADEVPAESKGAFIACADLLLRIRDEMFHIANTHVACEIEGV